MDTVIADLTPGCSAYDSRTNTGSIQHVESIAVVELGRIADQEAAILVKMTNQGHTVNAAQSQFQAG